MIEIFENYESEVRSYCRKFTNVFTTAKGSIIKAIDGKEYIDFFCGAGALNYGHNNEYIKEKVINYLENDGIIHSLDMYTKSKAEFIEYFEKNILIPRGLDYKIQFVGPTGTNSVEAAIKLARKVKKRQTIWAFMGAFHGMTLGSLALTSDLGSRNGAGVNLNNVVHIPAPYMFPELDTLNYMEKLLEDDHSGYEKPAAIIIETLQAEGGIWLFSNEYLKNLRSFCDKYDILLIIDDIQVGSGRTGTFFSFERANIVPDIVTLSKSIGGYGFPFAITLLKPSIDIWKPGEHNGTFRGNQIAMVAAKAALELLIKDNVLENLKEKEEYIEKFLNNRIQIINDKIQIRGIGMIWGIDVQDGVIAKKIILNCFEKGLILETAGRNDSVIKIMPSLVIENELLKNGLEILENVIKEVYNKF